MAADVFMSCTRRVGLRWIPLFGALIGLAGHASGEVKLIVPAGYLPNVPFLVRVEVRDSSGARDWNLWNAEASLAVDQLGVSLSTNRVALRNGLGTVLLTISGNANFALTANVNGTQTSRSVTNLSGQPITSTGGTLSGASTTWGGIVNVTSPVTVPAGHTLTLQPNTLVLINGVASGTAGINLIVNGTIQSLGTELNPVTITCSDANLNWGQIRHDNAQTSIYQHTFISKAGRAPGEGHTGTGPALRVNNSTISFESCVISDLTAGGSTIGKIAMASGSTLTLRDCVLARARMGPEIAGTGLVFTNSCIMEMRGPDDADGIYLHSAGGRSLTLSGCVLAGGDDDAVDTLDSNVTIENCILRDWPNPNEDAKGVSVFNGEVHLRRCLIADCFAGVSAKSGGPLAVVRIDHCTISSLTQGVSAATKVNAAAGNINIYVTNSIVRSAEALHSDFTPDKFVSVTYCDLALAWPGTGNITADPLFVNAAVGDYHLQSASPCIDAGDPAFPMDADGSRTELGFFPAQSKAGVFSVTITSPAPGVTFVAPANITIVAAANAAAGNITRMEFFEGGAKLGEDSTSPFSISWNNVAAGKHTLTAVATDATGLSATSSVVNVTVNAAPDLDQAGIVINEIMYHPASENPREEYLELFNRSSTPVNLEGWRLRKGVQFTFPKVSISPAGYLVVAADRATFQKKYPGVGNVVGDWQGLLNNNREEIVLDDAQGRPADGVRYADEGDWAVRRRGPLDRNHRGWIWFAEHDGLGKSLELINPAVTRKSGQNWAASLGPEGTPGRVNSVFGNEIAPLILNVAHYPIVPKSDEPIRVTAQVRADSGRELAVTLNYRVDRAVPPPFTALAMRDDGLNGDVSAGDGTFSTLLPPQANNTVVEIYVTASDTLGHLRTWPAPALPAADGAGPSGQVANVLFQVDDTVYAGSQPLYKLIMTETERAELAIIPSQSSAEGPNSQMNGTFISLDGNGTEVHYLAGFRNRGHGSRTANPPNYRVNFRTDDPWKGVTGINLNSRQVHMQHFGSSLAIKSGAAGTYSHPAQVRVNNANRASAGAGMFGSYAANEVYDSDWAERHFPFDSGGNLYKVVRDIRPPNFNYRGPGWNAYTNTYFKETNASENDWSDVIAMLQIMGENSGALFTTENARRVINVEQWLTHLAVMNLFANGESGLNTGNNDDYYMYRGLADKRFMLTFHDLDQILGQSGSLASNVDIFRATCCPISGDSEGAWRAMTRFLHWPEFESIYYATLQRLLDTTFAKPQFDALIDQTLGSYVPQATINSVKTWMDGRRTFVRSQLRPVIASSAPVATISGHPRSPTPRTSATLTVSGTDITHYSYSLNGEDYGPETPVGNLIQLVGLANGTNKIEVIGRNAAGIWQARTGATTHTWIVNSSWPTVRLNEVLAVNEDVVDRNGSFPDLIELFNEGTAPVNLAGMRLTDDPANPNRYTFANGATLAPGAYLVLDSNQLGFGLDQSGDGVYLFQSAAQGGALLDSVEFGFQVANYSIGRLGDRDEWALTQPTFGAVNSIQALGDSSGIKINEWLASGLSPYPEDFVEIYNPGTMPIALGGCYLTDQPIGAPNRSRIAPLTFIAARGYATFTSGNGNRASEINFNLASEQGEIALFGPDLTLIDSVMYGSQSAGISEGRCPDGNASQKLLAAPTPGGPNQCPSTPLPPQTVTLLAFNNVWKYEASGTDLGTVWKETDFDETGWRTGPGLLGFETAVLPEPLRTTFANANGISTFYFRTAFVVDPALAPSSYQITHLIDDGAAFYVNGREIGTRYNLPANAGFATFASTTVEASLQSFSIPANQLRAGTNTLAVEVHQVNRTSSDLVFGLKLEAVTITNSPAQAGLMINEVLANNATLEEPDGSRPDWVELYNPSPNTVDLAGMSLTDDVASPRRWIFPNGSLTPAKGFVKVRCDAEAAASATNTGFGLNSSGGAVYLFNRPNDGGGLQSSATYGLQAADWSIGRVPDGSTNWVVTSATLGTVNRPASLGNSRLLKINEWMADPVSGGDWFEIFNPNPDPVDLSHLWLSDDLSDLLKQQLPSLSFIGTGAHAFLRFEADQSMGAGAEHVNFKLSNTGEALALSTPGGVLIDGLSFGAQIKGVSQGRFPDGNANIVNFTSTVSPGSSNFLPLSDVVINELLSHSDPPLEDAVELYNWSATAVNVGGWFLSDSEENLRKYQIPANAVIPARGYLVLYEYQFNNPADPASEPFSFSSAKGDAVFLSQANNGVLTGHRAFATFAASENGVSFGRFPTSQGDHFVPLARRTFGNDNPATTNEFRLGVGAANAYAKVGPVVLSEIMYHPAGTNDALEFVELRNVSAETVPLYDPANPAHTWRLRKGIDFDFPQNMSIPAGGFLVVASFDPRSDSQLSAAFQSAYGSGFSLVGPYSGHLKDSADTIELQKPDPPQTLPGPDFGFVPYIVVDRLDYSDAAPWPSATDGAGHSLQRISPNLYGTDPVNWTAAAPNPGTATAAVGDSDNDGLPDDWESAHGLNPNDPADAARDSDGDGLSNKQEYLAGTNPQSAASALRASVAASSNGSVVLEFSAAANRTYSIEFRDSLADAVWQKLRDVGPEPSERVIQLPLAAGGSVRFFRIVLTPNLSQ